MKLSDLVNLEILFLLRLLLLDLDLEGVEGGVLDVPGEGGGLRGDDGALVRGLLLQGSLPGPDGAQFTLLQEK